MSQQERILVTGASGHLGQLVLEALLKAGRKNVIGTTRNPEKLTRFSGVEIRVADFKEPAGLTPAFEGATHLLLISTSDIGTRLQQHRHAIEAAKKGGVKHIFYTSWPNPDKSPAAVAPDHAQTEVLIRESGLKYTILRNYSYAENLLLSLPAAIETGTLYGCASDGKNAYVTRKDCADAAAGALLHAQAFENKTLEISGPRAYSYAEIAEIVSRYTGKKVKYLDLSPEEFKSVSMKSGLPEIFAQLFVSFDLAIKQGDVCKVTPWVERLSGHSPQDLRDFLKAAFKR